LCIYFEARGESLEAQTMVGHTVMNRMVNRKLSMREVIKQRKQFSWYNGGEIPAIKEPEVLFKCAAAALNCLAERTMGKTWDGVTHYFDDSIEPPYWTSSMEFLGKIDSFSCFKEG